MFTPQSRSQCVLLLREFMSITLRDARIVESRVFDINREDAQQYRQSIRRIAFNCQRFGMRSHDLAELHSVTDEMFAVGTEIQAWTEQAKAHDQRQHDLLNGRVNAVEEDGESHIKCRRCKSDDVDIRQAQTRSADESATLFYKCNSCNQRWKQS